MHVSAHDKRVAKNREYLKKLITNHLFLAKQNIVFRGHDESKGSLNKGNFLELLELRKKYVPIF